MQRLNQTFFHYPLQIRQPTSVERSKSTSDFVDRSWKGVCIEGKRKAIVDDQDAHDSGAGSEVSFNVGTTSGESPLKHVVDMRHSNTASVSNGMDKLRFVVGCGTHVYGNVDIY